MGTITRKEEEMQVTVSGNASPKFALVVLDLPVYIDGSEEKTKHLWQQFLVAIEIAVQQTSGTIKYAENVLLLSLENGLSNLVTVLAATIAAKRPYRVLFFDEEPNWITS